MDPWSNKNIQNLPAEVQFHYITVRNMHQRIVTKNYLVQSELTSYASTAETGQILKCCKALTLGLI